MLCIVTDLGSYFWDFFLGPKLSAFVFQFFYLCAGDGGQEQASTVPLSYTPLIVLEARNSK